MIKERIKVDLSQVLKKLQINPNDLEIEHPLDLNHGDFATNIALRVKRKELPIPFDLASKIVATWRSSGLPDYIAKIEVVKPGFINIWLENSFLVSQIEEVIKGKDKYGSSDFGKNKTVVIDYSSVNIAKPFGIGHLRSTIIGQAIYNLYKFLGYKVVGVNHLGDWGTQFGKLIVAIKRWNKGNIKDLTFEKLEKLYVKFHSQAEKRPQLEEEARAWFKKLEDKDPEARKIWKACVDISLKEFERIYELLGVKIDHNIGESFYEGKMEDVIILAKRKKIAVKSQGALVVKFPELDMLPAILLKSDGATTYETRDLACIAYRKKRWSPDLFIYEVGSDQKLHFQQTFAAAVKLGYGRPEQFIHVSHGLIRLEGERMSTRKGKTIHLERVLQEAVKRAQKIITSSENKEKLPKTQQKKIAKMVGVGAVKYLDLMHHHTSDIVFDWKKMFVLEGNSAPYLQYTYARCQSVMAKAEKEISFPEDTSHLKLKKEEENLLRALYKFPEVVQEAGEKFSPNLVCSFLFDLAQKYNLFYNKHSILGADNPYTIEFRLALTTAVSQIIKNGLTLLSIDTPERM